MGGNEKPKCPVGTKPCLCGDLNRKGNKPSKGKPSKGKPSEGGKGKGKGKGQGNNEKPEICCCQEQAPEPRGYCIDEERVGAICIAGSAMEEKFMPAWEACKDQCEGYMRSSAVLEMRQGKGKGKGKGKPSKGKGKGKPSKCPPVATIIEETAQKFACEICHFTEMGWIDI